MALWKKMTFWDKLKTTIGLFGTGGQVALLITNAPHLYNYITAGATFLGLLIPVWIDDKNANSVPDIFEDDKQNKI